MVYPLVTRLGKVTKGWCGRALESKAQPAEWQQ
jgi:hypothetical protein